jgi:carbon-monoxide dehydrogenase medium subunit
MQVGSAQIRAKGTLGGNLGNASPAGDSFPVLAAMGARLKTLNPDGVSRMIPVEDLVSRPGKTCLQVGECITEIQVPAESRIHSGFFKSVPRCAQALAKVSVAITLKVEDDMITCARVALGAVGPRVLRVENAEQFLIGRSIQDPGIDDVVSASVDAASPVDDFRATRDYRIRMIEVGVRRILGDMGCGGCEEK